MALTAATSVSASSSARTTACPGGSSPWRVGVAKADITPTAWPVAEAAYGIGRLAVSAAHPFYARAVAIQSCTNGQTLVFVALDSQGYFAGYREDPGVGVDGYGTAAIRQIVTRDTGLPGADVVITSTHTHNSPDSVGVWGGGSVANNKAPYLSRVRAQTVAAIEAALRARRPAVVRVGQADITPLIGTFSQVAHDPSDYPLDHTARVLQASDAATCRPIATLVNASVHATAAGEIDGPNGDAARGVIDPDWPGRVASDLERALPGDGAVVVTGAVGRTFPAFPPGTDPKRDQVTEATAYGDLMFRRVATALATSVPLAAGPAQAVESHLTEEIAEPALLALFADEGGVRDPTTGRLEIGGLMRSTALPFSVGPAVVGADVQTFRLGSLLLAGTPGEPYPQHQTELAKRLPGVPAPWVLNLANDQLGYLPPAYEYPVVAGLDGGDEGIFTINAHFGDDVINQHLTDARALGFTTVGGAYDGATAGPVNPPSGAGALVTPLPEPSSLPLSVACKGTGSSGRRPVHRARRRTARRPATARRRRHSHRHPHRHARRRAVAPRFTG